MGGIQSTPHDLDSQCSHSIIHTLSHCSVEDVRISYEKFKSVHYVTEDVQLDSETLSQVLPVSRSSGLELLKLLSAEDSQPVDAVGCLSTLLFFCHGHLSKKLDLYFNLQGWRKQQQQEKGLTRETIQTCLTQLLTYTDRVYAADPWMKHADEGSLSGSPQSFAGELVKELESTTGRSNIGYREVYKWLMASAAHSPRQDMLTDKNGLRNDNSSNNRVTPTVKLNRHTWLPLECGEGASTPSSRSKHAIAVHGNYIYLYGGRDGSIGHKDLWRFEIASNKWQRLQCRGDRPNLLQEHSMIAHKGKLYVFGGEFSASWSKDVPLWILDLGCLCWRKHSIVSEVSVPCSRRGQTAVVYSNAMHVYGGYMDLKGSSSELWTFDLEDEMWHLAYSSSMSCEGPGSRHSHSAVVHDRSMWIYGGMSDLQPRGDLWKWDFGIRKWAKIKTKNGPPPLAGHTACKVPGAMVLYGGESLGIIQSDLWKYTYETQSWQKVVCTGVLPPGRNHHEAIILPSFILHQAWLAAGTDRAHSVPQLQTGHHPSVNLNQRPRSSPAPAKDTQEKNKPTTTTTNNKHNFRNKVLPVLPTDSSLVIQTLCSNPDLTPVPATSDDSSILRQLKDKLDLSRRIDSVEILNEDAIYSEQKASSDAEFPSQSSQSDKNWYDVSSHAKVVRKHIHQLAKFRQIDTGSLCRLLSNPSDVTDDSYTFENPMFSMNLSEQQLDEQGMCGGGGLLGFDPSHLNQPRSVSVESIVSLSHNDKLPPPFWLDNKSPNSIQRGALRNALRSKSWDSLLKNFGGVGLKYVDIAEDPDAVELKTFNTDIVIEDLEGGESEFDQSSSTTSQISTIENKELDSSKINPKDNHFKDSSRNVLNAWNEIESSRFKESQETITSSGSRQNASTASNGSLPDILLDICSSKKGRVQERMSLSSCSSFGSSQNQGSMKNSEGEGEEEEEEEGTSNEPQYNMIEMKSFNVPAGRKTRKTRRAKKECASGKALKTYLRQRGLKSCEMVHMFVFGGKESESSNIGIKPLPLWRLDISI